MKGVKRRFIDIDWDKMKKIYPSIDDKQIRCMKDKWNPFRNWQQGFDSDCGMHCSLCDICSEAFYDERVEGKEHFKEIIIPVKEINKSADEEIWWGDIVIDIKE